MSFAFFNFINYMYIYILIHIIIDVNIHVCVCDCSPACWFSIGRCSLHTYIYIYVCMYGCMYACTKWHPCGLKQISCAYAYYALEVGRWCAEHLEQLHVCVCV